MTDQSAGHRVHVRALEPLGVGAVLVDGGGRVVHLSPLAESLTGWSADAARGRLVDEVLELTADGGEPPSLAPDADAPPHHAEAVLRRRDGQRFPVELAIAPAPDGGVEIALSERSERRLMALRLERVTTHDLLTGLLNRHSFIRHLERALEAHRRDGSPHALCFLDIDQLKLVNNTCGHEAGDELVAWAASLLREEVGEEDALARLSGDEFAVLLPGRDGEEAVAVTGRLQRRLREFVFTWGASRFSVSASTGIVPASGRLTSASQWLSTADHACSLAKDEGRGGVRVVEPDDHELSERFDEMQWLARIDSELRSGRALLYAQPIHCLREGNPGGLRMEVLLRFLDADGCTRVPRHLIRAAERFALTSTIDRWVIRSTVQALRRLGRDRLRRLEVCFVNLSGLSIHDPEVLDVIRGELAASGLPPAKLGFEITETAAVQSLHQARWFIQELSSIGCTLSLDDFGTGVASYGYLKELPVRYLKIDGSFVEGMVGSLLDRAMVDSINGISHVLGMETVAESVHSREVFESVAALGIDHAQGFWIAEPRPIEEVCRRLDGAVRAG